MGKVKHPLGNYFHKIQEMLERGEIKVASLTDVTVAHDDGCAQLSGKGVCDCDPDIRANPMREV